jgi:hypothetical protein
VLVRGQSVESRLLRLRLLAIAQKRPKQEIFSKASKGKCTFSAFRNSAAKPALFPLFLLPLTGEKKGRRKKKTIHRFFFSDKGRRKRERGAGFNDTRPSPLFMAFQINFFFTELTTEIIKELIILLADKKPPGSAFIYSAENKQTPVYV